MFLRWSLSVCYYVCNEYVANICLKPRPLRWIGWCFRRLENQNVTVYLNVEMFSQQPFFANLPSMTRASRRQRVDCFLEAFYFFIIVFFFLKKNSFILWNVWHKFAPVSHRSRYSRYKRVPQLPRFLSSFIKSWTRICPNTNDTGDSFQKCCI